MQKWVGESIGWRHFRSLERPLQEKTQNLGSANIEIIVDNF